MSKPRTGAPKRVAVGLLAGALAMFGVALAPSAGASASVTTERLAGTTRYGTAAAIAGSTTFATPTTAIVATGENFPDALAASTLAGANAQAPIVLTQSGTYTADAKTALAALKAKGVSALTIVGGTTAVSATVETAIKADGFTVTRVAGDDRYETAAAIATAANTKSAPAAIGGLKTALIATGVNFPDALAGGPAAYANKLPLLLVNDTVPADTASAISTLGIKKVVILGGTAAVSTTVEAALVAATGNPATRLAGTNRYGTATAVADYAKGTLAFPMTSAVLATGVNFPDALAAGPFAGQNKAAIVLTASLPAESQKWLDDNSATISKVWVSGGTTAVDEATLTAAKTAAQNTSNDSANKAVTTRPELVGASIVKTVATSEQTVTQPAGTYVRYTFDEILGAGFGANGSLFKVYNSAGLGVPITGTVTSATIETTAPATSTTVLVVFPSLTTAALAADLSVATVAFGAVRDAGGAENPEGSAPIGTAGTTTSAAGTTTAPDLVSVSNFRTASTTNKTAVDFTFDQVANVATISGFHLVDVNNNVSDCDSSSTASTGGGATTVPGGSGTTIITVTCLNANSGGTTLFSASSVARGYVEAGSVTTGLLGTGSANPWQAADVTGNGLGPDLLSVSYSPSTGAAIFTFDQAVLSATSANFRLYNSSGTPLAPSNSTTDPCSSATSSTTTTTCTINSTDARQVRIVFGLDTAVVGGYVLGHASTNNGGGVISTTGFRNQTDEESSASAVSTTRVPGKIAGPDLTAVALSSAPDAFGNATSIKATYTFDTAGTATLTSVNQAGFYLYFADGTRWVSNTCAAGTGTATTGAFGTVTCTGYQNSLTSAAPVTTALSAAVLGTVAQGVVTDGTNGVNPEGATATTGGTGTAAS